MYRLTTDNPTDNIEASLNLFYVRDGDAFIRGGGDAPDYADISVTDFIRKTARTLCPDMLLPESAEEISFAMAEYLFDGDEEPSGLIALLYTAAWSYAELRERLKAYEDTGLTPEELKAALTKPLFLRVAAQALGVDIGRLSELAEADKEGRVVVLPCKVGQRVFALLDTDKHISECEVKQIGLGNEIGFVGLEPIGARGRKYGVALNGLGKTVFLTREEAEKALAEMEGKKNGV